jgi:glycosyltransferase involved in cell wall biosynthesis
MRKKILLSAFMCDPTKGSEPGYGWNWALGLAKLDYEVHCLTRIVNKEVIEQGIKPSNLYFHYVRLPFGLEKLYASSTIAMYLYYVLWQWFAYKHAHRLNRKMRFDVAHHVTWGSIQLGSFIYKLDVPFVFGPAGGGQAAPPPFKQYFLNHWRTEERREAISKLMLKYNPACKNMIKKAEVILVSNYDTFEMVKAAGAKNIVFHLDTALPDDFYPSNPVIRTPKEGQLKLLWVGRFLPRKGLLLLLDMMDSLREYKGITLTVVGDGEMRDAFLQRIEDLKLQETVHWMGLVEYKQVKEYYMNHDIFVFTSLRDSVGLQMVEAMAFGMPVITIDLHGQALVVNEDRGFVVKCETPAIAIASLKEAVLKFLNDPDLLNSKGKAAYSFAKQKTWNNTIKDISGNHYPLKN